MSSGGESHQTGKALRRFANRQALDRAIARGEVFTTDQAVEYLAVRRSDFAHLTRSGWLQAVNWDGSPQPRGTGRRVVYRKTDLDALLNDPGIDWTEVRGTATGRLSPLAVLEPREEQRRASAG